MQGKKRVRLTVIAGLSLFFVYGIFSYQKDDREIRVISQGETGGWRAGDIIGYGITYLDDGGNVKLVGGSWALPYEGFNEPLKSAMKMAGVGGEAEYKAPDDDMVFTTSKWPEGKNLRGRVKVFFHLPKSRAVESFASENVYPLEVGLIAIDHAGIGKPDVLGGRPWQQKNSWYIDSENGRPFSMDGEGKRLWEWIGPSSGYLVWKDRGNFPEELSGKNLVGTPTGGQDWGNAYEVLEYADTDKNGWVEGEELARLGFWVDSNTNAIADEGELREASEVFQKISTKFSHDKYMARYNPRDGAVLANGMKVGSWEYWPRGETLAGGYLTRQTDRPPGFVYYERRELQEASADSYATMLIVDMCRRGEPDLLPRRRLGEASEQINRGDTVSIPLKASMDKSAAGAGGTIRQRWEWIGSCAGILVRPDILTAERKNISEYIYGSNTGGQDWINSYEPLSFLDVNGDGELTGIELDEVAVWVDRNANGLIEPGEVRSAGDTISSIGVKPTWDEKGFYKKEGGGVVFKDGSSGATWCWMTGGID